MKDAANFIEKVEILEELATFSEFAKFAKLADTAREDKRGAVARSALWKINNSLTPRCGRAFQGSVPPCLAREPQRVLHEIR